MTRISAASRRAIVLVLALLAVVFGGVADAIGWSDAASDTATQELRRAPGGGSMSVGGGSELGRVVVCLDDDGPDSDVTDDDVGDVSRARTSHRAVARDVRYVAVARYDREGPEPDGRGPPERRGARHPWRVV